MTNEEKERLVKLYNELSGVDIDNLYNYHCLITSGFECSEALKLVRKLNSLWLCDPLNRCISYLSDLLYTIYEEEENKLFEMDTTEILNYN